MGADYIGYTVIMPADERLHRPVLKEQIKKVEAALALAGGAGHFEDSSDEKMTEAIAALEAAGVEMFDLDGLASDEVLNTVAGYVATAKKFKLKEYQDLRTAGWTAHKINGIEVLFLNAGEMSFGDDPAELGNAACEELKALARIAYTALYDSVPWGPFGPVPTTPQQVSLLPVGLGLLQRQIRLLDQIQHRLDERARDAAEVEVGSVTVTKRTAREWANQLDGVANFLSEMRAIVERSREARVVAGED